MTRLAPLKEAMRDIAIEFRELPADRQEEYLEQVLVPWEQMMDEHDRRSPARGRDRRVHELQLRCEVRRTFNIRRIVWRVPRQGMSAFEAGLTCREPRALSANNHHFSADRARPDPADQ